MLTDDERVRNERLSVLFITSWYPTPKSPIHGTFIREHARAAARYADVAVLHVSPLESRGMWPVLDRDNDTELTHGVPTFRLGYPRSVPKTAYVSYVLSVLWAFAKLRAKGVRPDIIHGNVYTTGVPAVLAGMRYRVPVVISEHYSAFALGNLPRLEIWKARWAFRRANRIFPVSAYLRDAIRSRGIVGTFEVVPNAVDVELFHVGMNAESARKSQILFVGHLGLDDHKGLGALLRALTHLTAWRDDWSLVVVGAGDGRSRREREAACPELHGRVSFAGAQTRQEVADWMRKSSVLVLPSRLEMQPCVILEALASGLPVLATRVGGIPEILQRGTGWLIDSLEPARFASTLGTALDALPSIDHKQVAKVGNQFSQAAVGKQLARAYTTLHAQGRESWQKEIRR